MFASLGAVVIDADQIAREVVEPGTRGFDEVIRTFGAEVVSPDGKLDRQALAQEVFGDRDKLKALEQIVHPAVVAKVGELRSNAQPDALVIYDTPLLAEKEMAKDFDKVIMVTAPLAARIDRLMARGLLLEDIEKRIANQMSDAERNAIADYEIRNDGSLEALRKQVEQVWNEITS